MRNYVLCLALALAACTDSSEAQIVAPLSESTVYATVELRMRGHQLSGTTKTEIYVDLQRHAGELINNSLPEDCDAECNFVISFAGAEITNGMHNVAVFFFADDEQIASDAVPLLFAR